MSDIQITVVDGSGNVQFVVTAASLSDAIAQFGAGNMVQGIAPSDRHRLVNGAWRQKADAETIRPAKAAAWQRVKDSRDRKMRGTFTAAGRAYDCDREAIAMAASGAMLAKASLDLAWTKKWTLADNTSATLTADQVLVMVRACDDYISALFDTSRTLRAQISAAATTAEADTINWP